MSFLRKVFGTKKDSKIPIKKKSSNEKKNISPSICPYCSSILEKSPSRKTKCPSCEKYIYVRKGQLITENQKKVYQFTSKFEYLGVTVQDFNKYKNELTQEWEHSPSDNDVFWRILNVLITKQKDLNNLISIYEEMGNMVKAEGKDAASYYTQAKKIQVRMKRKELKDHEKLEGYVIGVQISAMNDNQTCSYCRNLDGQVFSLEQALEEMPIPGKCSSESRCRCMYSAIFEGEELQ